MEKRERTSVDALSETLVDLQDIPEAAILHPWWAAYVFGSGAAKTKTKYQHE